MIIDVILSILNKIVPKRKKIIFSSYPDIDGNALSLYEYVISQRDDIIREYDLKWIVNEKSVEEAQKILKKRNPEFDHKTERKKSITGILDFLSAKYIISTHSYFKNVKNTPKQYDVNLWHGMPFKRIGRLLENGHSDDYEDKAGITIATSAVFQNLMAEAFGISKDNVFITGQPRNDALLKESKLNLISDIKIDNVSKILFWLPTYRNSYFGDVRKDGNSEGFGLKSVLFDNFDAINDILIKNNYLLLIKPHPMDELSRLEFPKSDNIYVFKENTLSDNCIQLYELLSGCDILLTDYSSVFVDFLITGKPIVFICDDISDYGSSRGFCFDNPIEYMPGEKISNIAEFINYIENADKLNAKWTEQYRKVNSQFNLYCDAYSCQRVCNSLFGERSAN